MQGVIGTLALDTMGGGESKLLIDSTSDADAATSTGDSTGKSKHFWQTGGEKNGKREEEEQDQFLPS